MDKLLEIELVLGGDNVLGRNERNAAEFLLGDGFIFLQHVDVFRVVVSNRVGFFFERHGSILLKDRELFKSKK
jgi:hypothetical protein